MTKAERRNSALIARNRCVEEIWKNTDIDDRTALWKAAIRYNDLAREFEAGIACDSASRPLTARQGGQGPSREW